MKGVLDMVRERFTAVYSPHTCISVDEAMIPFKGETETLDVLVVGGSGPSLLGCNWLQKL